MSTGTWRAPPCVLMVLPLSIFMLITRASILTQMSSNSAAFGSRIDRGWVPPSLDDLEAEENSNDPQTREN
ncbi:hypothetical protein ACFL3I_12230 [Pseudomonadota bacterium]